MFQWAKRLRDAKRAERNKSIDKTLDNRRPSTVRKAQERAAKREKEQTKTIDTPVVVDDSMRGFERKWNDALSKKGSKALPILTVDEVTGIGDLLKFKPVAELVQMAKNGEDVKGMLNTVNTIINNAVTYGQIDKKKSAELKGRVKDLTKAYTEALNKKETKPQK